MSPAPLRGVNRLTSDSCLVLAAHVCSPLRRSHIRSVAPAPVLTVTQQNPPCVRLMRRLTLHIVRGSARSDPAGGEFTRTATPNGAHRGSGSQWAHQGGNGAEKMEMGGGLKN